uniref:DUF1758 domain-containing protein n=1 Tax=Amphimedon queenslandica TaxID=400682 RepID=A0A1X7TCC6_AMPQE
MADLEKKAKIRKGYRNLLTRRVKEGDELLKGMEESGDIDHVKLGQIKLSVGEKLTALKKVDEEIIELIDDGEAIVPTLLTDAKGTILLQTAQATVHNTESTESATLRLVFDSGSHRSYITEEVCRKLSLRIVGKKDLVIATFGNTGGRRQSCKIAQAVLETIDGNTLVLNLMVVPLICEPLVGVSLRDCIRGYDHLKDLDLADPGTNGDVIELDILIGLDYYWDIVSGKVLRGHCGPTATYSSLGWLLSGPVASASTTLVTHVLTCGVRAGQEKLELTEQLKKFWEIESLGICEKESTLYDQFKKNVTFDGKQYEVTLPWREDVSSIPDNYQLSLKRLDCFAD